MHEGPKAWFNLMTFATVLGSGHNLAMDLPMQGVVSSLLLPVNEQESWHAETTIRLLFSIILDDCDSEVYGI